MNANRSTGLHEITAIIPVNDNRFGMFTAEYDRLGLRGGAYTTENILMAAGKCVIGRPLSVQRYLFGDDRSSTYLTKPIALELCEYSELLTPLPREFTREDVLMMGSIVRLSGRIGVDPLQVDWIV